MDRLCWSVAVVIANGGSESEAFDMSPGTMGVIRMPAEWTAASVGFKAAAAPEGSGTFLPLYDDDGGLVQVDGPVASRAYSFPAALAGCRWVKLWSQNGTGTNTAQGAERVLSVDVKA